MSSSDFSTIIGDLKKAGIYPSKKLGQHFLFDTNILRKIREIAGIDKSSVVLEIGPGPGSLTEQLLEKASVVYAIEKDLRFVNFLRRRFSQRENLVLIEGDALVIDISAFEPRPVLLVSNLPYNIATNLLLSYLLRFDFIKKYVVMVQKEVADRITAQPGERDYSGLTAKIRALSDAKAHFLVKPGSFYPPPKVESKVISLTRSVKVSTKEIEGFFRFIDACFSQPRKMLVNNLVSELNIKKEHVAEVFGDLDIPTTIRPHQISITKLIDLYRKFKNM